jgi:small subunit ribosomal protein S5
MVLDGRIASMDEIFNQGFKIKEVEIVESLLPRLNQEVLDINLVQKQTDAGEKSRFKALVAVGNLDGYFGIGTGKAKQVRDAIQKGSIEAKLNIFPVKRGCGSWECDCGEPHTVPFKVSGKCGSVIIELIPGPKGLGIIANDTPKTVINLAGIKDCWTKSFGSTKTSLSLAFATNNALKNTYRILTPKDWAR